MYVYTHFVNEYKKNRDLAFLNPQQGMAPGNERPYNRRPSTDIVSDIKIPDSIT